MYIINYYLYSYLLLLKWSGLISKRQKSKTNVVSSDEEDDYFCIVCLGAYSKSRKGEDCIECTSCKKWHMKNVLENKIYYFLIVSIALQT